MEMADTIAAISTPQGTGAVAVIRISGPDAGRILKERFLSARPGFPSSGRDMSFGRLFDRSGDLIDEAICLFMKGPDSFTGEDVAEIQCHGGVAVSKAVLSSVLESGARLARPGEFSKRAFMNGKMSLPKAEALLSIIEATTEKGRKMASGLLDGKRARKAGRIRKSIKELLARMEAVLDWPDEMADEGRDVEASDITRIICSIDAMTEEAAKGSLLIDGISVAIIGRPNMGKSSLLNRLLGTDRAMVSDVPGTTRDTIEEIANVEGIPIRFADTAGISPTGDALVLEGIRRARKAAASSLLIIYVAALPEGLNAQDTKEISRIDGKKVIVALNKADLAGSEERAFLQAPEGIRSVYVSAKTGCGMDELRKAIASAAENLQEGQVDGQSQSRLVKCLEGCRARLKDASEALDMGVPREAVCLDIRDALYAIGELTGDTASEDIIGIMFDKFCIGK